MDGWTARAQCTVACRHILTIIAVMGMQAEALKAAREEEEAKAAGMLSSSDDGGLSGTDEAMRPLDEECSSDEGEHSESDFCGPGCYQPCLSVARVAF